MADYDKGLCRICGNPTGCGCPSDAKLSLSQRLDSLLSEFPDESWSISHDAEADFRVCTIVIDWRKVPGESVPMLSLVRPARKPEEG